MATSHHYNPQKVRNQNPRLHSASLRTDDLGSMAKMLNKLSFQGVEISKSAGATISTVAVILLNHSNTCSTGPKAFAAGTYIIRMDQPLRGYAKAEMEVQTYPVGILNYAYAGGPAVGVVPYDVTSWTMPMAMGVPSYNITDPSILTVPMSLVTNGQDRWRNS